MEIKDVENLAQLARIELEEDEKHEILSDMRGILNYVKAIERPSAEIDGSIEPASEVSQIYNILRIDELKPMDFSRDLIIGQFPEKQGDFLKVKKILPVP